MKAENYREAFVSFKKALDIDPIHLQARAMLKELEEMGYGSKKP